MRALNDVKFICRLCEDPQLFTTRSGRPKLVVRVAIPRPPHMPPKGSPNADFTTIVEYGDKAARDFPFLKKGSEILVEGSLQSRDIEGGRTAQEVFVHRMQFLSEINWEAEATE